MTPELAAVAFGLLSALSWGSGDFGGGVASRRLPATSVAFWVQCTGMGLFALLALARGEVFRVGDVGWSLAAGVSGAVGLVALYRAFATGQMGLVAPVSAVVGTSIPVVVGGLLEGLPKPVQLLGFALGLLGVWLASRSEGSGRPAGLGYALLAGLGFGFFFVLIDQVEGLFWPSTLSKLTSSLLILLVALRGRVAFPGRVWPLMLLSGALDAGGNIFFLLATQAGRLDVASVISSLYPAFTALWAWLLLRERLGSSQRIGVLCALGAIVLIAAF